MDDDWVRACQRVEVDGKRSRGRVVERVCCGGLESTCKARRRGGTVGEEVLGGTV